MSVEGRRFRKTTLALDGIRPQLVHGESKVLFTPLPANESLQHALNLAQEAYTTQNPQSYQAHQDASLVLANSAPRRVRNTSYLPFPLSHGLKEGECVTLDGQSYIDLADEEHDAFFRLSQRDMLASVIDNGNVKGRKSSESELAKMLIERYCVSGSSLVRFTGSSSKALLDTIAMARSFTKRETVMVLSSMTSLLLHQKERFITGAFNDIVKTTTALDTISEDTLAAILVPLIDDDDLVLATPAYLDFLALRARHAGALLIVDETTSSRIAPQGICRTVGVEPDLIVVGDWIGGGLPIGAVLGRRGIMDSTSSMILDTPGQTLCLAASLSTLQRSDAEYIAKLNKLGEDLRARLGTIFGNDESRIITNTSTSKSTLPSSPTHDILSDDSGSAIRITGVGSLTQIHFRGLQAEQLQPLFWYHMLSHGFLLGTSGRVDLNGRTSDECLVRFELAAKKFVEQYNILP